MWSSRDRQRLLDQPLPDQVHPVRRRLIAADGGTHGSHPLRDLEARQRQVLVELPDRLVVAPALVGCECLLERLPAGQASRTVDGAASRTGTATRSPRR
jgi:hypothetical protein